MSDRIETLTKNKTTEKAANHVPEAARLLAEEFGLTVNKSNQNGNGNLVFSLPAENCGLPPTVITRGSDLKALREDLTKKRDSLIERIEDENLVDILIEGEHLDITDTNGKPLKAEVRTPNFSQLTKIENSLQRSLREDENKNSGILGWLSELFDDDRVKIGLAATDTDTAASARYFHGNTSRGILPQLVIDPEVHNAESVYLHELAHHGQADFWKSDKVDGDQWKDYMLSLGWVRRGDRDLRITNDDNPQLFYYPEENNPNREWLRMNEMGNFVDAKGNPVSSQDKAQRITNEEMGRRALVSPPNESGYMKTPGEHGAELMMFLRQNESTRAALLRQNSHAYKVAVELDQREIDHKYGVDRSGQSRRIRLPNGDIVQNSQQSRFLVNNWESRNVHASNTFLRNMINGVMPSNHHTQTGVR